MNIKNLRKNYYNLSKRERLILYDAAENRDDKAEMDAILLATPNVDWIKPDWALQAEQLLKMRLVDLIYRLKYCRDAMFWLFLMLKCDLIGEGENKEENEDFFFEMARLNAYFYCVSEDSSQAVYEEMGVDVQAWRNKESKLFDLEYADDITEFQMRKLAFDESEAEAFIQRIGKEKGFENVILGFTFERKRIAFRDLLKEKGFKEFFKN